jgi:hypothetical protein
MSCHSDNPRDDPIARELSANRERITKMKKILPFIAMLFMSCASVGSVHAQDTILDDVDTSVEPAWAQIRVHFTLPVNYVRHFPEEHGQLLQIFFTASGLEAQKLSLREEVRNVAATPVMPATTITYEPPVSLNLQRDPSTLLVRFDHPVNYDVRPGEDHRSIVIYLPITPAEGNPDGKSPTNPASKHDPEK